MARGFAEQSGGALALSSVEGQGTKVSLWLPRAALAVASAAPGEISATAPRVAGHAQRVLVVDDDKLIRETVCETLELAGYHTVSAADAASALPIIARNGEIDLLLTDFSMPGLNGVGLIKEAQRYRPALPCILMTGYAGDVDELSNEKAASARFALLRKPVSGQMLFAKLAELLPDRVAPEAASRQLVDLP
jgi:CheY-like chemotaxis protein